MDEYPELPLSGVQEGFWALHQQDPSSASYNTFLAFRLFGEIDLAALQRSLDALVSRHDSLRAVFALRNGRPLQRFRTDVGCPLRVIDDPGLDQAEIVQRLTEEARRPFDLESGPVFRADLVRGSGVSALLLASHHIVMDRPSWLIAIDELARLYDSTLRAGEPQLATPATSYADFIRWEDARLSGPDGDRLRRYWHAELSGAPPELELPMDPAAGSSGTGTVSLDLSAAKTAELKRFAREERKTLYAVLLAGYQALLSRYTEQDQVVVGCPTQGGRSHGFEGLVGCLVNPVALRGDLSGEPSARRLLSRLHAKILSALAHSEYPLSRLVRELNPPRVAGRSPLFQTSLNLVKAYPRQLAFGSCRLETLDLPLQEGQFDLDVVAIDGGDRLSIRFKHGAVRLGRESVQRMAAHYHALLDGMMSLPRAPLHRLPIQTPAELRGAVLVGPTLRLPGHCLHELFERQARRRPSVVAVSDENDAVLTYRQLDERAEGVARRLVSLRPRRGDVIGLCLERTTDMVAALLGVLKAGCAYLPLDPTYPAARLEFMLRDSGSALILTQQSLRERLPSTTPLEFIDRPRPAPRDRAGRSRGDRRLAYVLYTSGSTGAPKGVAVEHRSVVNVLQSLRLELGLTEADVALAVTTLSFDIAALELLLPLISGARVDIASRRTALDGGALARRLASSRATLMQATPATWRLLLESGWRDGRGLKALCGGEAWPEELAGRLLEAGVSLWNVYGPTETTIWSMAGRIGAKGPLSLGHPIANTRVRLLDSHGQTPPILAAGEVWIGGAGVSRGYLNRPELTAMRFAPEPGKRGSRMYRTGDRARMLPNGSLEFLGRLDDQVKIRGFRIELGEVEAALLACPDVRAAAAAAAPGPAGQAILIAYVVGEGRLDASMLRERLRARLPGYMLPAAFVELSALPLTPNGKLDRKALPPFEASSSPGPSSPRPPRDEVEYKLAEAWRAVLGCFNPGVEDDFFDLGGDSLSAVDVARAASDAGVPITPMDVLERRTIAALAASVRRGS